MAASQTATEIVYFRGILRDLGCRQVDPTPLLVDNTGAVELAKELKSCARSRHIARRYFKVRELQLEGAIAVSHVPTGDNHSDILTKPLDKPTFEYHRSALMSVS